MQRQLSPLAWNDCKLYMIMDKKENKCKVCFCIGGDHILNKYKYLANMNTTIVSNDRKSR